MNADGREVREKPGSYGTHKEVQQFTEVNRAVRIAAASWQSRLRISQEQTLEGVRYIPTCMQAQAVDEMLECRYLPAVLQTLESIQRDTLRDHKTSVEAKKYGLNPVQ